MKVALEALRNEATIAELAADGGAPIRINLPAASATGTMIGDLKKMLQEHPGDAPVFLHLGQKVLRLPDQFNVDARNGLFAELRVLLGPNGLVT